MPDSRLTFRVTSDGLAAYVTVARGSLVPEAELLGKLQSAGIVAGIDRDRIQLLAAALQDPDFASDEILIAQGYAARTGHDAELELEFAAGIQAGHLHEDGSFDYHERDLLKPVMRGDILGRVHPAVPGIAGLRVDGTTVAAPTVRSLAIQLGTGATHDTDGVVRAARDGVIQYEPRELLDVVNHHIHKGPVDMHSGNLRMHGCLTVKGDVRHPFSVVTTGDLEIFGSVDAAIVRAGGKLTVHGGVHGGKDSIVSAEGDLTLTHTESSEVYSGGRLLVREAVNCQLSAACIRVTGKCRGGAAVAETDIVVTEAGAANGVDTRLTAGEPLSLPVLDAKRMIESIRIERMAQRAGGRSSGRDKGGKLGRVRAELELAEVQRLAERARRRELLQATASIQVSIAHPGVTVQIGKAQHTVSSRVASMRYSYDAESAAMRAERVTK